MTVDRVDFVVAYAIKKLQHPNRNSFPAFAKGVLFAKFQVSPAVATSEIKTLDAAWKADKWQSIIQNLPYQVTQEEREKWELSYKSVSCII